MKHEYWKATITEENGEYLYQLKRTKMNETGIRWKSETKYVDIETGHILRSKDATNKYKYIIIKTTKNVTINKNKTVGTTQYTRECRKQPQQKLNFS